MKTSIHPTYYNDTLVACSCGNTFPTGSTKKEIRVEICYNCHPLYTGEKRYVDTLGQVGKFQEKQKLAEAWKAQKVDRKREEKAQDRPKTLRELLGEM